MKSVFIEPENELASLLLVTSIDVRHVHLNGTPINGASRHATVETQVSTVLELINNSTGNKCMTCLLNCRLWSSITATAPFAGCITSFPWWSFVALLWPIWLSAGIYLPPPCLVWIVSCVVFFFPFVVACAQFRFNLLIHTWLTFVPSAVSQVALDWVSGNWYFLDDNKELIFLCNSTLTICTTVVEVNLNKPRALALDPPNG